MKSRGALFAARALPPRFSSISAENRGCSPSPSARRSLVGLPIAKFWGLLLGDVTAAVKAMLDRPLRHGHVRKRGPPSWRHGRHPMMVHLHSFAPIHKEEGILRWGPCPHAPGIYRFTARIAGLLGTAGAAPPRWCALPHSGRWIDAPVASLRCRILRPGPTSIGQYATNVNFLLVAAIGGRV